MSKHWIIPLTAVAVTAGLAGSRALWGKPPAAGDGEGAAERKLDLTVYNQDFGMVHESRPFRLVGGANRLLLPDVSRELDPHSVLLRWAGPATGGPEIVGHSYELGAQDSQRLLSQQVGRPVELVRYGENGQEASRESGRLLLAENGRPAVEQVGDQVYVDPPGTLVLPGEEAARAVPQLVVQAQSSGAGSSLLDVAYLTRGLSWSADYVATLAGGDDSRMDLECYATVTNRTGVPFPAAAVTLVAGTPNRAAKVATASKPNPYNMPSGGSIMLGNADATAFQAPEAVGDLHAYPLKNPATIQNDELNRLLMFRRAAARARKEYSYRAPYLDGYSSPVQERGKIAVSLSFMNTPAASVGQPLPQGTIRVYDPDRGGRLRYAGAGEILPTPKNRKVSFALAEAFDVLAAYRVAGTQKISKRAVRKQVVVHLTNEKAHAVPVRVVQDFGQRWTITGESTPHAKLNAQAAQWTVPVPAGGAADLRYTVDLAW